jgi:phosphoglycolate phosphatase-like HAD superfamily hydrolase
MAHSTTNLSSFDLQFFDLLLFDLDGTLVDSAPDIAAAVDETLADRAWPVAGVERVRSWIGNGSRKLMERAVLFATNSSDEALLHAAHDEFLVHYARHNGPETRIFPGVLEFLAHCQHIGKKNGLCYEQARVFGTRTAQASRHGKIFFYCDWRRHFPTTQTRPNRSTALL